MRKPVFMLRHGNALRELSKLQDESVNAICTSVPFFLLRGYRGKQALGLEETIEMWGHELTKVFDEAKRVLHRTGVCFIVVGEAWYSQRSFAGPGKAAGGAFKRKHDAAGEVIGRKLQRHHDLKDKDLTLQGPYLAMCLRKAGWWLRCLVILETTNPAPQSAHDRPIQSHQYMIMVTKQPRSYFWDYVSSRERGVAHDRLLRTVWSGPIEPAPVYKIAGKDFKHTSIYPRWVVEKALTAAIGEAGCCPKCLTQWTTILSKAKGGSTGEAWHDHQNDIENGNCKKKSSAGYEPSIVKGWKPGCKCGVGVDPVPAVVLDMFAGVSTTGVVAMTKGADYVGIDLDKRCVRASTIRLKEHEKLLETPLFDSRKSARKQAEMFPEVAGR
jgi:DNA modification methylase